MSKLRDHMQSAREALNAAYSEMSTLPWQHPTIQKIVKADDLLRGLLEQNEIRIIHDVAQAVLDEIDRPKVEIARALLSDEVDGGNCNVCGGPVRYGERHHGCGGAVLKAVREAIERERAAPAKREDMAKFSDYLRAHPEESSEFFRSAGVDEIVKAARGAK